MMQPIRTLHDGWQEMVMDVQPILAAASRRGIPIDVEEREKFIKELHKEREIVYASIQLKVKDEMRKMHPTEGYVRLPDIAAELMQQYKDRLPFITVAPGKKLITMTDYVTKMSVREIIKKEKGVEKRTGTYEKLRYAQFEVIDKKTLESKGVFGRWAWVQDFNPNSSKQIIAYMKAMGHKVPVKITGEETSDAKELERLAIQTKDGMYDEIIEYRQINKMLTNDLPNWAPNAKTGAVHTEFGFLPATGQINSRNPNVQNANKHKPLGKRFRRIIRARNNGDRWRGGRRRRLVEVDYSGFHAIMLGREARSAKYIFLSQSDVHSWMGSRIVGNNPIECPRDFKGETPEGRADIARFLARLKDFKAEHKVVRDTQAKPSILGIGLGLGPRKLYWMNREKLDRKSGKMIGIRSEADAKLYQGILKEELPELFSYQQRQKDKAHDQTYLINRWGMIRWFFDVKGEDGEKAVAFDVQGNAHGMLRWVMRRLEDDGLLERYCFINTIHDSLIFEPYEDEVEQCIMDVVRYMETPCKVLADPYVCPDGLIVRAEPSVGDNWAEYDEKINPGGMKVWKPAPIILPRAA